MQYYFQSAELPISPKFSLLTANVVNFNRRDPTVV